MENAKTANNLTGTRFAFIGSGVMAESMIAGLLREEIVSHEQIVAGHPRANRRDELAERYKIQAFERNADAVTGPRGRVFDRSSLHQTAAPLKRASRSRGHSDR